MLAVVSVHVIISVLIFLYTRLFILWFDGQNNMASIMIMHTVPQGGFSPLYAASQEGHTDIVDILLRSGADVHQTIIKVRIYAVISLIYACSLVHRIHLPH